MANQSPRKDTSRASSVKDVAVHAGVSLGTVSNVLNRPEIVSAKTRAKVEEAMAQLGFVRNEFARQLRMGTSPTLAYVMLDGRNPYFADVAQGIELTAEQHAYTLFLCNSNSDRHREESHLAHLLQQRVQGILITPIDPLANSLDQIKARRVPLVILDRTRDDTRFCSVSVDDVLGGRLAVEHLVDLGHRRVAVIGGPQSLGQVRDRFTGARDAWLKAGLPPEDLTTFKTPSLTIDDGRDVAQRVLGIPSTRRPTAAFCANDLVALGLLQQVIGAGWTVPQDLSIVGYDDIDFAAAAVVPLTSIRQPRQELGRRAAELLLSESADPEHEHQQVVFEPELIARTSSAPPSKPGRLPN